MNGRSKSAHKYPVRLSTGDYLATTVYGMGNAGPVIMFWPAMGVRARYYQTFCEALCEHGFSVAITDFRGFGDSTPATRRGSSASYHEIATVDYPAVADLLSDLFPGRPRILLGHSLGGQIGVMYAANFPNSVSGIAFVAANLPHFRLYPGASALGPLVGTAVADALSRAVGYFPGDRLKFMGRQPAPVIRDWAKLSRTGDFNQIGNGAPYRELLTRVKAPVLAVSIEGDWMAPGTAVDGLAASFPQAPLTRWHATADDTGGRPAGHIAWAKNSASIAARVAEWADAAVLQREQGE